jgi:hypothetical protein
MIRSNDLESVWQYSKEPESAFGVGGCDCGVTYGDGFPHENELWIRDHQYPIQCPYFLLTFYPHEVNTP